MMTQVQIKSSDVIRLILQFLNENNLLKSFEVLQSQSKISLNTISSKQLSKLIMNSQWDLVLQRMNVLMFSQQNLFSLYEIIIDDLIEKNKFAAAKFLLDNCVDKKLQIKFKERYLRLQYICENVSQKDLYKKPVTMVRKQQLCRKIMKQIHEQPQPNRLLSLLAQSIKYQALQGVIKPHVKVCLYQNKSVMPQNQLQGVIKNVEKTIQYSAQSRVTSLSMSNSGEYLAIGSVDGLIQIYDTIQYVLHSGLSYQSEGVMLFHEDSVTNMVFNSGDQMLLSSDSSGLVKVWGVQNGKLLRKFQAPHNKVSVLSWGFDPSHILFGHQTLSLFGLKSSNQLKQYNTNNHNQFLLDIVLKNNHILSCTTNGTIKSFHYSTQQELFRINLNEQVVQMVKLQSSILICLHNRIIRYNIGLQQVQKWSIDGNNTDNSQLTACCSIDRFVYECIKGNDKKYRLNVRDSQNNKVITYSVIQPISIMAMHPKRNLLVTYDETEQLKFWRPQ